MNYLITGATGNVGSLVARGLVEMGERPRLFVRDEAKARKRFGDRVEIVAGDLSSEASLADAFLGVERLFLVNSGADLAARDHLAASVAHRLGVRHIVKLSTMDVRHRNVGTGVWHAQGEAAIRASGVGFTFVQPSGFMVNALAWAPAIKAHGVVSGATGDGRIAFIHPADIAAVATAALTTDRFDGQSLPITGPEALSYADMVAKIGVVIGKRLVFRAISEEEERQRWRAREESPEAIDYHLSIFRAIREGRLADVTDAVKRVLGQQPITFDHWVRENASAFE
jgi:(4-alkanoyl-5-oxo-2,5-dihydrofuran-3-yl)methyl phosphate reductase